MNKISQSAVSQQLKAMEKHFGIHIVDRVYKQFKLTDQGACLYEFAQDTLHHYEELLHKVTDLENTVSGTVHLSSVYSVGLHELPPKVKIFMREYPDAHIKLQYRQAEQVYSDILNNISDIGLVAFPLKHKDIAVVPFATDKLTLVCSPDNPLAKETAVDLKDIAQFKFIAFDSQMPTAKAVASMFKARSLVLDAHMEFDNIEIVKRAVETDSGIAIVPENAVKQEVSQGVLHQIHIKGPPCERPLALIHLKKKKLSLAMKAFITVMTEGFS